MQVLLFMEMACDIDVSGRHTLRIRTGDPGMVIQKIVLDFGGMKRSYLGPPSTRVIPIYSQQN